MSQKAELTVTAVRTPNPIFDQMLRMKMETSVLSLSAMKFATFFSNSVWLNVSGQEMINV
jgi:hypothetical protein